MNRLRSPGAPDIVRVLRGWPLWGKVAGSVACAFVAYLIATPLVALVLTSLSGSATGLRATGTAFSPSNFVQVFRTASAASIVVNSVVYSLGTVLLSLAMTIVLSFLIERSDLPGRGFLRTLILGPMGVPPVVMAIAWVLLGNPRNGLLSLGGRLDVLTLPGMIFVTATVMVPSMYLMLSGQFTQLDPALEDAAAATGVGFLQRTRRVTLALLKPALLAGGIFFFLISLEAFDVAAVIGLPRNIYVLSTAIYNAVYGTGGAPQYGIAAAYGVLLVVLSLLLIGWYRRAISGPNRRFAVVTGKGYRPTRIRLGRLRLPAMAFVLVTACIGTLAPLAVLLWSSLLPFYGGLRQNLAAKLTLTNYADVLHAPGLLPAVWHTAVIVLVASTVTILLSAWAAWSMDRGRFPAARVVPDGSFILLGVPGVVVGISLIFWYLILPRLHVPIHLYGTVWILVIAYVTRFLAYASRLMDTAVRQIDRDLEAAGYASGVGGWQVARRVTWPLLAPAMVRGWLWVAIHILREIPIAVLLVTASNETIAASLWQYWSTSTSTSQVSAFAAMLTLLSMAATWGMSRFSTREEQIEAGL